MAFKKIEDMDYYEILGLSRDASAGEVASAYRTAVSTYAPDALASYGLVSDKERALILDRIDKAYHVLLNPEARNQYDEETLGCTGLSPRAQFRRTVQPLEIQDVGERRRGVFSRIKKLFGRD
jgi:DnaJ-class molecular chaperone